MFLSKDQHANFSQNIPLLIKNQLNKEERLTVLQKKDLMITLKSLFRSHLRELSFFFTSFTRCFCGDLLENYIPIVGSKEVDWISFTADEQIATRQFDVYNRNYVQQHVEVYKNFIPRVEELKDWLIDSSGKLMETILLCQYFYLYLCLGDLARLRQRLEAETKGDSRQAKAILFEEINAFAKRCKSDRPLQEKVIEILCDTALTAHTSLYRIFDRAHSLFSNIHIYSAAILDGPLTFAKKFSSHLFDHTVAPSLASLSPSSSKPPALSRNKGKTRPLTSADQDDKTLLGSSESSKAPSAFKSKPAQPISSPILFEERLQTLKEGMLETLSELQKQPKGFGMVEALGNVKAHWCNMLCVWKRLIDRKESLSDQEFAAFILDIVREGSLVVEQSLTALDCSSNEIKDQSELTDHLTHDLVNLLFRCSFHNGILPHQIRNWIHELNRGEILLRDLTECSIDGSDVEKLLTKARLLIEEKDVFKRDAVHSHLIQYFNKVGMICLELQKQIGSDCFFKPKRFIEKVQALQANFKEISNTLETTLVIPKVVENLDLLSTAKPVKIAYSELEGIGQSIAALTEQAPFSTIVSNLNDLHNNLFLQLGQELEFHSSLQPIDGHLHLSKVCLLDQLIAERFLLNLLDALNIDYDLTAIDHDLSQLVRALGMKKKDFSALEWDFLSNGKAVRLLTRYPASHSTFQKSKAGKPAQLPMEKSIHAAINMSQRKVFAKENPLESGYALGDPKVDKEMKVIKQIVLTDLKLLSSILGKVMQEKAGMLAAEL
jgi:hypothetical protein